MVVLVALVLKSAANGGTRLHNAHLTYRRALPSGLINQWLAGSEGA